MATEAKYGRNRRYIRETSTVLGIGSDHSSKRRKRIRTGQGTSEFSLTFRRKFGYLMIGKTKKNLLHFPTIGTKRKCDQEIVSCRSRDLTYQDVNIIGDFDDQNHCRIGQSNAIILHPDVLVTSTVIGESYQCMRKSVLGYKHKVGRQ